MANLRQLQKKATRKRLLEAALEQFERNGYVATTIDDIAAEAGTTRVTFYSYFESRQDLMRALIGEMNEILERHEQPGRGSTTKTLVDAIADGSTESIRAWLLRQSGRWPRIRQYILSATEASAVDPEIRVVFNAWMEEVIIDITEGLDIADRFDPATRHHRAEFAFTALDHTAISWMREGWESTAEHPKFLVLVEVWAKMVGAAGACDHP
ncbi:MAG: TetR/AcrR family transcriptional regulator [Microbacteriaceae bacterium]|nr:TetR/AcrR family transcriptional regulator [Microbacteriaceae bacterium]